MVKQYFLLQEKALKQEIMTLKSIYYAMNVSNT